MTYSRRKELGAKSAFSLIELLMVMFIIALTCVIAVPAFAKLAKTSKVDQAANMVMAAMYHARAEAQHYRTAVAVYYGDDCAGITPVPMAGVLPAPGQVELWTVTAFDSDGFGNCTGAYYPTNPNSCPGWYPFRFPDRKLSEYTLPDGIRVMAGTFTVSGTNGYFDFPNYRKDSTGEIKRHHSVYAGRGSVAPNGTYYDVVVFDEASGDHVVIEAGQWQSSTRPRLFTHRITNIGSQSKSTKLTKPSDLTKMLDTFPGNS